jgi:hypothetical protein
MLNYLSILDYNKSLQQINQFVQGQRQQVPPHNHQLHTSLVEILLSVLLR